MLLPLWASHSWRLQPYCDILVWKQCFQTETISVHTSVLAPYQFETPENVEWNNGEDMIVFI